MSSKSNDRSRNPFGIEESLDNNSVLRNNQVHHQSSDDPTLQHRLISLANPATDSYLICSHSSSNSSNSSNSSKKRKANQISTQLNASYQNQTSTARQVLDQLSNNHNVIKKEFKDLQCQLENVEVRLTAKQVELDASEQEIAQISKKLVDDLLEEASPWNNMYFHLDQFYNQEGHLRIPWKKEAKEIGPILNKLGPWLVQQRKDFREKKLEPYKICALEKLSMEWEPCKSHWMARYEDLKAYKEREGHVKVPYQIEGHRKLKNGEILKPVYHSLGVWVKRQRFQYKMLQKGNFTKAAEMNEEKIHLLEKLGFDWALRGDSSAQSMERWMESYQGLKLYYKKHGHAKVTEVEDKPLFEWCKNQQLKLSKHATNESDLTDEQVELLQACNPVVRESKVETRLAQLKEFVAKFGHGVIPPHYPGNAKLANWAANQRRQWKAWKNGEKSNMTAERERLLSEAGLEFNPTKDRKKESKVECRSWDDYFHELCSTLAAKKRSGKVNMNMISNRRRHLKEWCEEQRVEYALLKWNKTCVITQEQVNQLEEIGFDWHLDPTKIPSQGWEENYNELLTHFIKTESFDVKQASSTLQAWVKVQRSEYQKFIEEIPSCLSLDQIQKLDKVNFPWQDVGAHGNIEKSDRGKMILTSTTKSWEEMFSELMQQQIKLKCFSLIPTNMEELLLWMANQRAMKDEYESRKQNRSAVIEERIRRLKAIGFPWEAECSRSENIKKPSPNSTETIKFTKKSTTAGFSPSTESLLPSNNHPCLYPAPVTALPFMSSFQMLTNAFSMGASVTMATLANQTMPNSYQQTFLQHQLVQAQQHQMQSDTNELHGQNLNKAALAVMNELKQQTMDTNLVAMTSCVIELEPTFMSPSKHTSASLGVKQKLLPPTS